MSFNNFLIVTIGGYYYRIHFWCLSKNKVMNRMKNADKNEKNDDYDDISLL